MDSQRKDMKSSVPRILFFLFLFGLTTADLFHSYAFDAPSSAIHLTKATEAKRVYAEAVALYKAKRYVESKEKFLEVESIQPGYRATKDFINRIDHAIQDQKDSSSEARQREFLNQIRQEKTQERQLQKKVAEKQEPQDDAQKSTGEEIQNETPSEKTPQPSPLDVSAVVKERGHRQELEQQVRDRQQELKNEQEEINQEFNQRLETLYTKAVQLYENGEYLRARDIFQEVKALRPGYEQTQKYLFQIDSDGNPAPSKKEAKKIKAPTAVSARAKTIQEELEAAESGGYKDPRSAKIAEKNKQLSKKTKSKQDRLNQKAEAVYSNAMSLYLGRDYRSAKKRFLQVEKISPGYKSTRDYLRRIDHQIKGNGNSLIKINGVQVE